jgi:hypothetical protein
VSFNSLRDIYVAVFDCFVFDTLVAGQELFGVVIHEAAAIRVQILIVIRFLDFLISIGRGRLGAPLG